MGTALPSILAAGAKGLTGIGQILFAGKRKKERALEDFSKSAPQYGGSQELSEVYEQGRQLANVAPGQTAQYKMGQQQIARNLATGLSNPNIGQGGVAKLVQGATDASMRNVVGAEQLKEQRMARLGALAGQKAAETMQKFRINKMQPWETQYNLLAARAAQAANQQQSGFQNLAGGLTSLGTALMPGSNKTNTTTNTTTTGTP